MAMYCTSYLTCSHNHQHLVIRREICENDQIDYRNNLSAPPLMKIILHIAFSLFMFSSIHAHAGFIQLFKDEEGETKWQHVANFSSSVLILLLLISVISLLINFLNARKANKELTLIKADLEKRVAERTATLDQSNILLQNANGMLEGEIKEHKETTSRLISSETYVKSILDSMPLMLIGLNKDLSITQWNRLSKETTGMPAEQVIGKQLWDVYPTITLSPEQVTDVLKNGGTTTIKHSQRGQYYFDITLYALKDHPETGIIILIDDVTQRSKAENLLIQRDKFSSMGELAAAMAHDINIPLRAIVNDIEKLKTTVAANDLSPEILNHCLEDGHENSRQATAIVSHLLKFSNSDNSEKQLCHIPDIADHALVIAGAMFSNTDGLKFSDIKIDRSYAKDLRKIPCHISEIQQVFVSLLRHACYSLGKTNRTDHKPFIKIDVSEFYDSLWIKVQHNGHGLTSDEQMMIFEPFYQSDDQENSYNLENRLSFSYFIITEHHEGEMSVTSDVNVGTTFHIQLLLR